MTITLTKANFVGFDLLIYLCFLFFSFIFLFFLLYDLIWWFWFKNYGLTIIQWKGRLANMLITANYQQIHTLCCVFLGTGSSALSLVQTLKSQARIRTLKFLSNVYFFSANLPKIYKQGKRFLTSKFCYYKNSTLIIIFR